MTLVLITFSIYIAAVVLTILDIFKVRPVFGMNPVANTAGNNIPETGVATI